MSSKPLPASFRRMETLLAKRSFLFSVFDELPYGVALLDLRGRLLHVNQAYEQLTGARGDKLRGVGCLHAMRCDFCLQGCPVLAGERSFLPVRTETSLISRDRRTVRVRLSVAPLADDDGRVAGFLETVHELGMPGTDAESRVDEYSIAGMVGKSPEILRVFQMVPSVAQTDSSVLITGETGTGKDVLAEAIHKASERSRHPFVKVNCGALPDTLLESELFGHVKGAFTGADRTKPGRIRQAHGGTLFLTEIGDLPLSLQVKLLSFLDDKVIHPLGSTEEFHADVRVIAATNRDLERMARERSFRQDLLFRLNVIRTHMPPLRERSGDIDLLLDHFLKEYAGRFKKRVAGFSEGARTRLGTYPYPGNVRELRNIVEYAVNFCDGDTIRERHLPLYVVRQAEQAQPAPEAAPQHPPTSSEQASPARPAPSQSPSTGTWDEMERTMIVHALQMARGRRQDAASQLGWSRSTLWRKMRRHGLVEDS